MSHSSADVAQAIDLVLDEIKSENDRIMKEGGEEMSRGNKAVARKTLFLVDKLQEFSDKVAQLKNEWSKLQDEMNVPSPEGQEIVIPTREVVHEANNVSSPEDQEIVIPTRDTLQEVNNVSSPEVPETIPQTMPRQYKTGCKRNVEHRAPAENFRCRFHKDGIVIENPDACITFAKCIEKMGVESVASKHFMLGKEPLVSTSKSCYQKKREGLVELSGGWFVKTHSGTDEKIRNLIKIAQALHINITCEKFEK